MYGSDTVDWVLSLFELFSLSVSSNERFRISHNFGCLNQSRLALILQPFYATACVSPVKLFAQTTIKVIDWMVAFDIDQMVGNRWVLYIALSPYNEQASSDWFLLDSSYAENWCIQGLMKLVHFCFFDTAAAVVTMRQATAPDFLFLTLHMLPNPLNTSAEMLGSTSCKHSVLVISLTVLVLNRSGWFSGKRSNSHMAVRSVELVPQRQMIKYTGTD